MNAKINTPDHLPSSEKVSSAHILQQAQQYAKQHELNFTGSVSPVDAWHLIQQGQAVLVDVRTNEERKFVGYVEDTIHIPWATGTALNRNPRFAKELETKVGKDKIIGNGKMKLSY